MLLRCESLEPPMSQLGHKQTGHHDLGQVRFAPLKADTREPTSTRPLSADFVAEVGDYYARGLPRFVDTSSYYAAFGER
jgi:hypothetical protein